MKDHGRDEGAKSKDVAEGYDVQSRPRRLEAETGDSHAKAGDWKTRSETKLQDGID